MTDEAKTVDAMASLTDCGVCGSPLVYAAESVLRVCGLCGEEKTTMSWCPEGHFVCDDCHSAAAMDVVHRVVATTTSCDA